MKISARNALLLFVTTALFGSALRLIGADDEGEKTPSARIREEGLNHSQVMETMTYLCDVIGPRLTGSPNGKRASEWTRDKLTSWGLTNAQLEAWGPFGRGWSLQRFSLQVIEPQFHSVLAFPNAWSPGLDAPLEAEAVYLDATNRTDLEKYKGKLKGAIVLLSPEREMNFRYDPLGQRLNETNLLRLANAGEGGSSMYRSGVSDTVFQRPPAGTNANRSRFAGARGRSSTRFLSFCMNEGAAAVLTTGGMGEAGTVVVMSASVPPPDAETTNRPSGFANLPRVYSTNAPAIPPQITVATEDYNHILRLLKTGEKVKLGLEFKAQFHSDDLMAYNTVAELPGTDLKDEVVMLGGHLDSWHAGTGATDNGIGVAVAMEAVRIIKAAGLKPRRTIRIALWSGEEQGLLGSRAYVARHIGYMTNAPVTTPLRSPKDEVATTVSFKTGDTNSTASTSTNSTTVRKLIRLADYEKISAYFNLDNGAGKVRGMFLQGNEAVRPFFRRWMTPYKDLDAETLSLYNTGSTDHTSFDSVGIPAFQFIQDPLDYNTRTHHTNQDVLERINPEDAKQAAVLMAAFVYNAAMEDERLPRKKVDF